MIARVGFRAWVTQWGFAILVGLAVLVATYVAWRAEVPSEVPDFALNAAAVYRIERKKQARHS